MNSFTVICTIFLISIASTATYGLPSADIVSNGNHANPDGSQGKILPALDKGASANLGVPYCSSCDDDSDVGNTTESHQHNHPEDETTKDICILCGEPIVPQEGREFICKHKFHKQCIRKYVEKQSTFCPICRKDLQLADGRSYTKLIAQQMEKYYTTPLKYWGLQSTRKLQ